MKWLELDINNLPKQEVLAACFDKSNAYAYRYKLLGYVHYNDTKEMIVCKNEYEVLESCTHYIPIHSFDDEMHINQPKEEKQ